MDKRPVLAVTMGDPAGIGPEIAVQAFMRPDLYGQCRPLLVGDAAVMEHTAKNVMKMACRINAVRQPDEAGFRCGVMDVLDLANVDMSRFRFGKVDAMCGEAAFRAVEKAIGLALSGQVDGTVTGPINKEAIHLAGHHYSGHTEIYADLTKTRNYAMLLGGEKLNVVHVTTHVALDKVPERITRARVLDVIVLGHDAMKRLGFPTPRIAVCGLNPHAGENGLFGGEEKSAILPAVEDARARGIDAQGPFPPDTIFCKAAGGAFDLVVAMYHDQGHIPLKLLSFKYDAKTQRWGDMTGVNITLGLPIVRASVDHGTAFGHAGMGLSNPNSLIYAMQCGARLSAR